MPPVDYGFVPGKTSGRANNPSHADNLRRLFDGVRADTELVEVPSDPTVQGFVTHLTTGVTLPARDLLLGTHAGSSGWMEVRLSSQQKESTRWKWIQEAIDKPATHGVGIDASVFDFPDENAEHSFHIKGCNVGKAPVFLAKFKEALDVNPPQGSFYVTAPKHFHGVRPLLNTPAVLEYMYYEFVAFAHPNHRIGNREALLDMFIATTKQIGPDASTAVGSTFSKDFLRPFVPKNIHTQLSPPFPYKLGFTVGKIKSLDFPVTFESKLDLPFSYMVTYNPNASIPALSDRAGHLAGLSGAFANDVAFLPEGEGSGEYPFPEWRQRGYNNFDAFFNGYRWSFAQPKKNEPKIAVTGKRWRYELAVPITFLDDDKRIFKNLHRGDSTTLPDNHMELLETDVRFFSRV